MNASDSQPSIIQLLGQARSGKDFTATQLKLYYESIGKSVEILSYAAPMKQIAATLFDISLEQLDDFKNQPINYPLTVTSLYTGMPVVQLDFRTFLQRLGNEAVKPLFGDAVWANLMQQAISKSSADIIIIPDCRFTTELQTFPTSITVRVINSSLEPPMDHASELELLDYLVDFTIDNTDYKLTNEEIIHLAESILKGPHNGN